VILSHLAIDFHEIMNAFLLRRRPIIFMVFFYPGGCFARFGRMLGVICRGSFALSTGVAGGNLLVRSFGRHLDFWFDTVLWSRISNAKAVSFADDMSVVWEPGVCSIDYGVFAVKLV
jgi:hypothetical protein